MASRKGRTTALTPTGTYELKDLREERKQQLLDSVKEKEVARRQESLKVEEVRAALKALKKAKREGETLHMSSLKGKNFRLYSPECLDCFSSTDCWEVLSSKYVEFYDEYELLAIPCDEADKKKRGKRTVDGQVHLNGGTCFGIQPFRSPTRPSRKKRQLKTGDGPTPLTFQFIGDDYLTLRISRGLVFSCHQGPIPESAPEVIEFMGIRRDREKERLERQRRNRSPSPREAWFEMTHPMGTWNQSY